MLTEWRTTASLVILGALLSISQCYAGGTDGGDVLRIRMGAPAWRDGGQFYQGEPILVHVYIARKGTDDPGGEKRLRIGTEKLPWYDNLTFRVYRVGSAAQGDKTAADEAGGGESEGDGSATSKPATTKVLLKDAQVKKHGRQSKKEELGTKELTRCFWAIDPAQTAQWRAGKYIIEAVFDTTGRRKSHPNIVHVRLQSNEVGITVNEPKDDKSKAEVKRAQAKYLMGLQKYDEAIKACAEALRLNPQMGEIHCRLGRAYELKGDIRTAIKEYRAYVDWVRSLKRPRAGEDDINDHADIIERMINVMEKWLEKRDSKPAKE